jgi:hypothetical protein
MITSSSARFRILAGFAIAAAVVLAAMGADRARSNRQAVIAPQRQAFLFSATEIIHLPGGNPAYDSDIARLDTTTGAIYRFHGNADKASVKNTWELRVPPVKGPHSGLLEVQQIRTGDRRTTFLVDIVEGHTWILRHRASTNASWDPVDVHRR